MEKKMSSSLQEDIAKAGSPAAAADLSTMLFCIGAQKAGTTTLHAYLNAHKQCHFRGVKEIGFFSRRGEDVRSNNYFQGALSRWEENAFGAPAKRVKQKLHEIRRVMEIIQTDDIEAYHEFLLGGLQSGDIAGDFFPGYAREDRSVFQEMMHFHDNTKFVFLMRDPVERVWSGARHHSRVVESKKSRDAVQQVSNSQIESLLRGTNQFLDLNSDYERTIKELEAVAPSERVFVDTFEGLLSPESGTISRLQEFLAISDEGRELPQANQGIAVDIDPDVRTALRKHFSRQYDFVREYLGELPAGWMA